jgi:hypothetical protein
MLTLHKLEDSSTFLGWVSGWPDEFLLF